MDLSPEQLEALRQSAADMAIVAAAGTGLDPDIIRKFFLAAKQFVVTHKAVLKDKHFAFVLGKITSGHKLTKQRMAQELANGKSVIEVDEELAFVSAQSGKVTLTGAQERGNKARSIELLCWGTWGFSLAAGVLLKDEDLSNPSSVPPTPNQWKRPIAQIVEILDDHMGRVVKREQGVKYWKDKGKRILLNPDGGTERIFHRSLFWWLGENVSDLIRIAGETRGLGQDAMDILMVTSAGSFIIEVKWLGNNGSKKYGQLRIDQGLLQVKLYLENDKALIWGHLVCYDGRSEEAHLKESCFDASQKHADCLEPSILFLDSKTPSEIADALKK